MKDKLILYSNNLFINISYWINLMWVNIFILSENLKPEYIRIPWEFKTLIYSYLYSVKFCNMNIFIFSKRPKYILIFVQYCVIPTFNIWNVWEPGCNKKQRKYLILYPNKSPFRHPLTANCLLPSVTYIRSLWNNK